MLRVGGAMVLGVGGATADTSRPLRRAVDTLDTLRLTSRTFRGLASTPCFPRVAVRAGQPHASSRQTEGSDAVRVGMWRSGVLERAGEAESLAVLADVPSAVTAHLSQAAGRAGLARLLGRSVGRVGGGSISGYLSCRVRSGHLDAHVFHVHAS